MAKIKDNSKAIIAESDRLIKQKLEIAALMVESTAKLPGYCPVLTGTARRSIISNWYGAKGTRSIEWSESTQIINGKKVHVKAGETSIDPQSVKRAVIGSNVEYFPYIELGTSKMPARAPLRRALETNQNRIRRLFGVR